MALKVANVATKYLIRATNYLTKIAPKLYPKLLNLHCPKNLFGLFLTFRVISILQGYFWRPSKKTL